MSDVRLVRFAAVLLVLAGYLVVFRAGEQRLGTQISANAMLAAQLREASRVLASRAQLEPERNRLRERLRAVDLDGDRSALVARFVHAAARIALTNRTTIPTLAASGTPSPVDPAAPFETIPLELALEGRYENVLATIRALSKARVLATVDVLSLARKNADAGDATLVATLRVLLEHLAPAVRSGARNQPA
jgi:Tfp pilus assembly protein PilO